MKEQEKFDGEAGFMSRVADWFGMSAADAQLETDESGDDWMLGAEGWVHSASQGNDSSKHATRVSL